MALKLFRPEQKDPSWLTTVKPTQPEVVVIVTPPNTGSFTDRSLAERNKSAAMARRHVLTPEERARGLANIGKPKYLTPAQEIAEAEEAKRYKPESKFSALKYKTYRSQRGVDNSAKLFIGNKEQYKRTELTEYGIPIVEPVFGVTKYGKQRKQEKQYGLPKRFVERVEPTKVNPPTARLYRQQERVLSAAEIEEENRKRRLFEESEVRYRKQLAENQRKKEMRSLFGGSGFFESVAASKPERPVKPSTPIKPSTPEQHRKKKPVEHKYKIIKKHYRKYPKHCVKPKRR